MTDRSARSGDIARPAPAPAPAPETEAAGAGAADFRALFAAAPGHYLVLAPDAPRFTVVAASDAFLEATRTRRETAVGRPLFDVFAEAFTEAVADASADTGPERSAPSGAARVQTSLETVLRTRAPHTLPTVRSDLERPDGTREVRFWAPRTRPVPAADGGVRYLLHEVEDVTERVEARAATAAAERRAAELQAVLESIADAVYIGGAEGITLANQAALDQLGFTTREELNRSIATLAEEILTRDAATGAFIPAERQAFTRALGGERVVQDVLVRHRTLGEDRVVRCAAAPVVVDGRVVAAVAVNTDVTDARRAAAERERLVAAVTAEQALLRLLIRDVPAPVALHLGPEHRFALLSDAFRAVSGGRDLTGMTPQEAYPEVVGHGILERFDEVVATGRPWVSSETHARFDRRGTGVEDTWFDIRYQPVRDAAGCVIGVLNFSFDVTEQVRARRQAEAQARLLAARTAELEASQDRLRLALEAAAMAYWDFDPKTDVTVRSEHHDRLYGHAAPLAVWNFDVYLAHVHPDDRARVADRFARALRDEAEWRVESRVVWPDGSVHWIATQGTVFRDPDGTPNRVVGVISDVTARRQAEAERERLLADAESARREAEAARIAAEEARSTSEAANRAKGEFLAVMSHELRTPLNAIGGYAELMAMGIRGPVTDQQREDLSRIQRSQRALLSVINEVLDYARVETGVVTYDLADVPVAEAVGAAEVLVAPQLRAKGLAYGWAGGDPALAARADPDKLQQILLNLLSNAVKFTEARDGEPGRVEVSATADRAGHRVVIRVHDTGIGIPADKLASIFEPFVQVDTALTRAQQGTGLGLAISRDLARGMGGDLTAESTPGVGSTFTLTLPAA